MSNIVDLGNMDPASETTNASGGLDIVGQQDQMNDVELKGDGNVGFIGGNLSDTVSTGAGNANVFTGEGEDEIMGGIGNDTFRGGEGDDEIHGGIGADTLLGGAGDDILVSGRGQTVDEDGNLLDTPIGDVLSGGTGNDIFRFVADEIGTGVDLITDFKDDDFADTIRIFGVGADADIQYENGIVSVDGQDLVNIGEGQDITTEYDEDSDSWSLF